MPPKIPTYTQQILPSGRGQEVFQPYDTSYTPTPINIGAAETAAKVRLAGTIGREAGDIFRLNEQIKKDNEEAIATTALINFKTRGLGAVRAAKQALGPDAVATVEQQGITQRYQEARMLEANEEIDEQPWSASTKKAARTAYAAAVLAEASQVSVHEQSQNVIVNQQAINLVVSDAAATIRENPLDDAVVNGAIKGVMSTLALRAPGDTNAAEQARQILVDARIDGLIIQDPDKAAEFLAENKSLIGDDYEKQRKRVTIAQIERDSLINPGITLEKLSQPTFYKDLTPQERAAAVTGVIAQIKGRETLTAIRNKRRDENNTYNYFDIINRGVDPETREVTISPGQRGLAAISYLNDLLANRKIGLKTYEHLLAASKEGVTTDFKSYQDFKIAVALGEVEVDKIVAAEGIGAGDKSLLLLQKRNTDNMLAQLDAMKRNELTTARNMAARLMLPTGYSPSPEQANTFLNFNVNLNEAVRKGDDPTEYFINNAWRYMTHAIPVTKYGVPQNINEVNRFGIKLTGAYKRGEITDSVYNLEAEKLAQARRILEALEENKKGAK